MDPEATHPALVVQSILKACVRWQWRVSFMGLEKGDASLCPFAINRCISKAPDSVINVICNMSKMYKRGSRNEPRGPLRGNHQVTYLSHYIPLYHTPPPRPPPSPQPNPTKQTFTQRKQTSAQPKHVLESRRPPPAVPPPPAPAPPPPPPAGRLPPPQLFRPEQDFLGGSSWGYVVGLVQREPRAKTTTCASLHVWACLFSVGALFGWCKREAKRRLTHFGGSSCLTHSQLWDRGAWFD